MPVALPTDPVAALAIDEAAEVMLDALQVGRVSLTSHRGRIEQLHVPLTSSTDERTSPRARTADVVARLTTRRREHAGHSVSDRISSTFLRQTRGSNDAARLGAKTGGEG